jgi:hypothetical protein
MRCLVIVLVVAVSTAISALPAAADKPSKSMFNETDYNDLTDVCSFTVRVKSDLNITQIDFVDANGALTRISRHVVLQDTFTANEKKLVGIPFTFSMEILFDSSGNVTHVFADGVAERIPLPDGSLFISAGRLDFMAHPDVYFLLSPDKGNPGNVVGFCAALAP